MRDLFEFALYWFGTVFFSLLIVIPVAAAFLWVIFVLVAAVHDGV